MIKDLEVRFKYKEYFNPSFDWNNWTFYRKENLNIFTNDEFLKCFKNKVDWFLISALKNSLSEDFIDKYSNYVDWYAITMYQTLSEDFIEKHSDKVNWDNVSEYQKFSNDFVKKFQHKLNFDKLKLR